MLIPLYKGKGTTSYGNLKMLANVIRVFEERIQRIVEINEIK